MTADLVIKYARPPQNDGNLSNLEVTYTKIYGSIIACIISLLANKKKAPIKQFRNSHNYLNTHLYCSAVTAFFPDLSTIGSNHTYPSKKITSDLY